MSYINKFFNGNKGKNNYINRFNDISSKFKGCITDKNYSNHYYDITMKIKPTYESNEYLINIKHNKNEQPIVCVVKPNIYDLTKGKKPPHVYKFTQKTCKICLYMKSDWNNKNYDSDLIPWISEWLFYFEMWLITSKWHGGGHSDEKIS